MIWGIFILINPNAAQNLFNSLVASTQTAQTQETEKKADEYSRFASLFRKSDQTLGNLISTGTSTTETSTTGTTNLETENLTTLTGETSNSNTGTTQSGTSLLESDIAVLSWIIASESKKNNPEEINYTRDEEGNYLFDAELYEVGVIEGKLRISLKKNTASSENTQTENTQTTTTQQEEKSDSIPVISSINTRPKVITPINTTTPLSQQDLKEAQEIFGN